jgi:hypothetical protein
MDKTEEKTCQNCKKDFVIESEDFGFYEKVGVPAPTFCPECRLIRRLRFRNERHLYKRPCDLCKKDILSVYGEHVKVKVFCPACWWSDDWDALENGRDYDFSRPFFEQFQELLQNAPIQARFVIHTSLINSEYNNLAGYLKNCYMVFHADYNEDSMYASGLKRSKNCVDVTMLQSSEFCYQCVNVTNGYKNFYSVDCEDCRDVYFSKNCVNCSDCFGCTDLKNKKYCWFNEQLTKEEYESRLKEAEVGNYSYVQKYIEEAKEKSLKYPHRYMHGRQNVNSSGDYLYNCKNTLSLMNHLVLKIVSTASLTAQKLQRIVTTIVSGAQMRS